MSRQIAFFTNKLNYRSEGTQPVIEGLAVPYEQWSSPIYGFFKEKFKAGAFRDFLATNPDVFALREHNPQHLLGRTKSGTLTLKESDEGVFATVSVPNTTYANDLVESIRRKDIQGMSFYFESETEHEEWAKEDGMRTRVISKAKLGEVTFTSCPFYEGTTAQVRSMDAMTKDEMIEFISKRNKQIQGTPNCDIARLKLMELGGK